MPKVAKGICDNRCQLFQTEALTKEHDLRIKWFLKNQKRLIKNLGTESLIKRAKEIAAQQEAERQQRIAETEAIRKKYSCPVQLPSWRPLNHDDSVNIDVMKPVDPKVKQLLYEDGVESFIASNNYLRERWKAFPENRFYYPDCTSWLYGWRLKDYPPIEASKYGLKAIMKAEFYQRTGSAVERDPDWYRSCQTRNAKDYYEVVIN